jgi:hypothetical protein
MSGRAVSWVEGVMPDHGQRYQGSSELGRRCEDGGGQPRKSSFAEMNLAVRGRQSQRIRWRHGESAYQPEDAA